MLRAAVLLATATTGFAATYSVVPVRVPTGFSFVAMGGINNAGQVAVTAANGGINGAIFVGSPTAITPVPLPSGWTSANAYAINTSGQVAGTAYNGTASAAFIGGASGSAVIPLPAGVPSAASSYGHALNDSGQVVGAFQGVPYAPAFVGTTSGSTLFPSLGISPAAPTGLANAVNNSGLTAGAIVTSYFLSGSAGTILNYQEFIGTPAGVTLVSPPSGYTSAEARAINAFGQVAGIASSWEGVSDIVEQAFIGTVAGSTLIPLPAGGCGATVARQSINDLGTVVGTSCLGWIWDATNGTRLLNTLVPSGWNVTNGISISNNGLILAQASFQGGASQYVELIPASVPATPAPSTLVLVLIGAMFCGIWLRLRQKAGWGMVL